MIVDGIRKQHGLPIGSRIKVRRKSLGLTLQQLARTSGLSAPFISQAERNKTAPSIVSRMKLAQALDVDIGYFLEVPQDSSVVQRADRQPRIAIDSPVEYFQLGADLPEQRMDAILMRIPPGHNFPVDQREGEDFLYVLSGELYVEAGGVKTLLKPGDSMHFDSRLPHTARNDTENEVLLLYVGTPSIFASQPGHGTGG